MLASGIIPLPSSVLKIDERREMREERRELREKHIGEI